MERLIELFINTEDGEFYDRGGLLAAYDPAINAGELVRLTVQLCAGVPAFNSTGALLNPDTTFAGTLAAAETIIDNNFNWYDKGTLLENLTTGTAISELSVTSEASPRPLGAVRLNADTVVNFCGWTATEGGYRLTLADNEFNPAQFTPGTDFAQGAAVEVLEQPIIVSAQNDDSGRDTGLFSGLLDAANPVYESMIEGHEDIPNCRIEFSIYQDGRAVFRARRYFDCLGAMAMNKGAAYVHSDSWREADSRYIKLVDWQAPPEYQFSEDGTNWHDQQQDADLYYHERRPGGQWGPAVKMKTGPTGAAAGFGTPTVTVENLPAGSDATASVTASGDDTAKVFSFNLGIPKGADGKNGTNGADGAAGADGVSSYTYVAYASDASGAGFSLTPSNALKFRAEIHTTTAIETPDAEDFAGATWVKYLGDDGTGAGDMTKSVYDTDDDGIVDHAATADAVGATTAAQVADAVGKAHTHANKTTLDKLAETDGKLTFDGAEIGGASNWNDITGKPETFPPSAHNHAITDVTGLEDALQKAGTVKSVNGQLPDESGNVTVEIGSTIDESRLLPMLDSVPVDRSGNPVVFKAVSEGMDEHTLLYCPFDADFNDHSSYARTVTHDTSRAGLSISLERNKFGTGSLQGTGYTTAGAVYVQMPTPIGAADFTIHKWIYVTSAADRFGIFSTYGEAGSGTGTPGYGVDGLACWIDTDGTLKLYKASAHFSSYWYDDDSGNKLAEAAMPSDYLNRWVHIAVARSGNIWMLFADGSLLNSNSKEFNAVQPYLRIGSADSKATAYGNIDEFIVLDYAKWITDFEPPTQPASEVTKSYEVSDKGAGTVDESRLLPENPANGDIPCFDATATIGGGNDAHTKILLHFDADEIKDEAAGNAAPVTITKKTGTITVVEGGKWGKCAKYVTGSMTVATNLDELNANNWVVSGWFNPDENNHGVSYPTWLSMDDQNTHGFGFDSTGRYGESDGPLFYMDTPPASGTWHWLAIVKYSGGLRFYLNGAFLNEISAQQRANFCSTLAIGGFAGTYAAGSTERTFSGLVDEVRLQYIPDDEITQWTGTSIAVPDAPYSKPQTVGEWSKFNKSELVKSVNGQTPDSSGAVTLPEATTSAAGLMSATDREKSIGLTTRGIYPNAWAKAGAVDFNELIDHGFYFIGGDTPHLNYPETYQQNGGTVQVIRTGNYLTQTFIPVGVNKVFTRSCVNAQSESSERTFSEWRRLLTDTEITESKARPGYFKLPGGTIVQWGAASNITADGSTQITFPVAFPNAFLIGNATAVSGNASASGVVVSLAAVLSTGMTLLTKNHPGNGNDINVHWLAIGY